MPALTGAFSLPLNSFSFIRNLEIIGEADTLISPEIQQTHPQIPWTQMKGIRNILIHEYFGVDEDVVWQTVQKDLPQLAKQLHDLFHA